MHFITLSLNFLIQLSPCLRRESEMSTMCRTAAALGKIQEGLPGGVIDESAIIDLANDIESVILLGVGSSWS